MMNGSDSTRPCKRCAVYCRVSTDERLDQEFNSIDAQRESGRAYVVSQRSEGWVAVVDDYDDPGYSGGNTDRPGLRRLLNDIDNGKIDVVVVYKIDRLTRSLADFSKMVDLFEQHGVSFVSVTQQFNTTTSMGRLMLNVLLSFAQFEREVTGERIRDKIGAAKRKGLWMGGVPPLGYDVKNRQLVVNEGEAAIVRRVFRDMLSISSTTRIAAALNAEGITTKAWTTQSGQVRSGVRVDKQYLHKMLRNRIYRGELSLKGNWYPGAHPAIVDLELWESVQAILARNARRRAVETNQRSRTDALLRGLLFDTAGEPMYATFVRKKHKQYRYYVSRPEAKYGAGAKTSARLPADQIEGATVAQLKTVLASPEAIAAVCAALRKSGTAVNESQAVVAMHRLGNVWDQLCSAECHRIVSLMIERIDLVPGGLKIKWRELGWNAVLTEFTRDSIGAELVELEVAA